MLSVLSRIASAQLMPVALLRGGVPGIGIIAQIARLILFALMQKTEEPLLGRLQGIGIRVGAGALLFNRPEASIPPFLSKAVDNLVCAARLYDQWQEVRKAALNLQYAFQGVTRVEMCVDLLDGSRTETKRDKDYYNTLFHAATEFFVELLKLAVYLDDLRHSLNSNEDRSYLLIENGYQILQLIRKHRPEFNMMARHAGLPEVRVIEEGIQELKRMMDLMASVSELGSMRW